MAGKRRCRKIPHDTKEEAIKQAEEVRHRNGDNVHLNVYLCTYPAHRGKWHCGHPRKRKGKEQKKKEI